jgi:hypothetical protein
MRFADWIVMGGAALLAVACVSTKLEPETAASDSDCAVIAAISKEHYRFGPDNVPPPLKAFGESGWRPACDWPAHGLAFTDYTEVPPSADPRQRVRYVEFARPTYDSSGAHVETSIMHGPLAGMGYVCHLRSGFTGWTVDRCDNGWVS